MGDYGGLWVRWGAGARAHSKTRGKEAKIGKQCMFCTPDGRGNFPGHDAFWHLAKMRTNAQMWMIMGSDE